MIFSRLLLLLNKTKILLLFILSPQKKLQWCYRWPGHAILIWGFHYPTVQTEHVFIEPTGYYLWDKPFASLTDLHAWFKTKGYKQWKAYREQWEVNMDKRMKEVGEGTRNSFLTKFFLGNWKEVLMFFSLHRVIF